MLAVRKGAAQDCIILQNALVVCCLEAGAAGTSAPIVTSTIIWGIGALVFAGLSIEYYNQGASVFSAAGGDERMLA